MILTASPAAPANRASTPVFGQITGKTAEAGPCQLHPAEWDQFKKERHIPDEAYNVLLQMPNTELHVHQYGSSGLSFLKYNLLKDAYHKQHAIRNTIERTDPLTGERTTHDLHQMPFDELKALLHMNNVRQFYRMAVQQERGKLFSPDGMNGSDKQAVTGNASEQQARKEAIRQDSLRLYRKTSEKIYPYAKNIPGSYKVAYDFVMDMALDNVRYSEYRVSPSKNDNGDSEGISADNLGEALYWINEGLSDGKNKLNRARVPFDYGLVIIFNRHSSPEENEALARQVVALKKEFNIVGVDLAGSEDQYPVTDFAGAFQIIRDYNAQTAPKDRIGITIHAGEVQQSGPMSGVESIEHSLAIGSDENTPFRIGHGLQIINASPTLQRAFQAFVRDPDHWQEQYPPELILRETPLLRSLIDRQVVVEMCPKSNVQTFGVNYYYEHPAVFLSRLGLKVAISTDNRTISNSTVPNEYNKLFKHANGTYEDFKQMCLNGFEGSFIFDPGKKARLISEARKELAQLEANPANIRGIYMLNHQGEAPDTTTMLRLKILAYMRKALLFGQETILSWCTLLRERVNRNPGP
ncbi:MAG: adenosine deaminase [Candidatus Melainabacteria bacterium]